LTYLQENITALVYESIWKILADDRIIRLFRATTQYKKCYETHDLKRPRPENNYFKAIFLFGIDIVKLPNFNFKKDHKVKSFRLHSYFLCKA
jgi:hypothetical protein